MSASLEPGIVGSANIAALIDARAEVVWACLPRMDGDPLACSLLRERRGSFVASFDGEGLDATLLQLAELGFVSAADPRYGATVAAIERDLMKDGFVFRYTEPDDFGAPQHAFLVCSFWFVDALAAVGRRDEARALFEGLLACRNRHGLLAEHVDPATRELWGNFPQTYSMVRLVNSATRLSISWDEAF